MRAAARAFAAQIEATEGAPRRQCSAAAPLMAKRLGEGRQAFLDVAAFVVEQPRPLFDALAFAGSVPDLLLANLRGLELGVRRCRRASSPPVKMLSMRSRSPSPSTPSTCRRACRAARQRGRRRRGGQPQPSPSMFDERFVSTSPAGAPAQPPSRALELAIERTADTRLRSRHFQPSS